jgi:hypothetical protein
MAPRTTYSGGSPPPVSGVAFLNEYAARLKTLFDASALPLTAVGGTGNVVTATLDPVLDGGGLVDGMKFTITWANANTGGVTLALNGGTAVPVVDAADTALVASALQAGTRALLEYVGGKFRVLSGGADAGGGASPQRQVFTASGTWTKPAGYDDDHPVLVKLWGGGQSGGRGSGNNGGQGGYYEERLFRMADLPSSAAVGIGAGGLARSTSGAGNPGGNTTFGSLLTAYGGGSTDALRAVIEQPGSGGNTVTGSPGTAGGIARNAGGGGGGGSNVTPGAGGDSIYGGDGGAGSNTTAATGGQAPGGGGGGTITGTSGAGARGQAEVWVL